ncbi:MAG: hypothetical protein QOD10_146 [Mycobacterium sp.]|nr:hypothetical protein [Mycobacterium sp.]
MLTLRDQNVADYATLRDMDTTNVAVLDETDRACLDELGHYLVSTDAWRRFAIWLLHKHFEPAVGEVFAESVIAAPPGTRTTLVERRSTPDLIPTSLRFDADVSSGVGVIGMEFAGPADFGFTASVSDDDEAVLAGIAERLLAHGKTEPFGVRLIRNPLGLSDNEVLVETCDIAHRTLRCSVDDRDGVSADNNVETTWQWKPSPGETEPAVTLYCMMMCGSDPDGGHYIAGHTTIPE